MHRLYYSPGACSLAVHIVLEEIGAPYETELRSTHNSEGTSAPDYVGLNPKARVPSLTGVSGNAGGAPDLLTEVSAILIFLARNHPAAGLLPPDAAAEARCIEWLSWISIDLHGIGYGELWRPQRFASDPALHGAVTAKGSDNIRACYDHIERILSDGRDWAVPGQYTVVDPYLLVFWMWGKSIGFDMGEGWPRWSGLMGTVLKRPAVQRALQQEKLI